ncbi:MAG: hypothetical protein U0166_02405 [Acidobacteriota bacterium]
MVILVLVIPAWSCKKGPSEAEGKALLEEIRRTVTTDAADKQIAELEEKWNVNELGATPKEIEELREKGHQARLRAMCVDIAQTERDVSHKVAELRRLSAEWKVPLSSLTIRVEKQERKVDENTLAEVLRRGYVSEAKYWLSEYLNAKQDYERVANFEMLKQSLKDAHATPSEIGITDTKLIAILRD